MHPKIALCLQAGGRPTHQGKQHPVPGQPGKQSLCTEQASRLLYKPSVRGPAFGLALVFPQQAANTRCDRDTCTYFCTLLKYLRAKTCSTRRTAVMQAMMTMPFTLSPFL